MTVAELLHIPELIFLGIVLVTMGGAALAVFADSIIHALLGLVAAMFGIAGLYVYLHSPFLAMMQILIYVSAISVLLAFAIMLAGPFYPQPKEWATLNKLIATFGITWRNLAKFVAAAGIAGISIGLCGWFVLETFPLEGNPAFAMGTKQIGRVFFDELALPFELISLLIVVGILGAIMLALFSREHP